MRGRHLSRVGRRPSNERQQSVVHPLQNRTGQLRPRRPAEYQETRASHARDRKQTTILSDVRKQSHSPTRASSHQRDSVPPQKPLGGSSPDGRWCPKMTPNLTPSSLDGGGNLGTLAGSFGAA